MVCIIIGLLRKTINCYAWIRDSGFFGPSTWSCARTSAVAKDIGIFWNRRCAGWELINKLHPFKFTWRDRQQNQNDKNFDIWFLSIVIYVFWFCCLAFYLFSSVVLDDGVLFINIVVQRGNEYEVNEWGNSPDSVVRMIVSTNNHCRVYSL